LKGMISNFWAADALLAAAELESAALSGELQRSKYAYEAVNSCVAQLVAELDEFLKSLETPQV